MRVGWIGLGMMGLAMARCAARAGHDVVGFTRGRPAHRALIEDGGRLSTALAEVAGHADLLCLNLFDDTQLRQLLYDDGLLAMLRAGSVLVVHTTGDPALARALAAEAPAGVEVVDGAFSGTPEQAVAGTLTVMAGGSVAAFGRVRPLFESYAAFVRHVGETGAGMQLKLINNLLFAAQVRLAEDAFRLAATAGFDAATVAEVLGRCSAASRALAIIGEGGRVAENAARMRFYVDKDVAVAGNIADEAGIELGLVGAVARGGGSAG
jgi:3-hydroxyisobutyrate dehydrogenase-like beta-hydroxyacid dehydrogenase